jgi:formate hydrogenlyase subunit 4
MTAVIVLGHLAAVVIAPILVVGVITRVKARWAGRRGPPLVQLAFDLWRLVGKDLVRSTTTTAVFAAAPWVVLATALAATLVVPLAGPAPLSFGYDFLLVIYLWGLGRLALMLGALDTGSPFEGMGASREATFGALLEPAVILTLIALAAAAEQPSLAGALAVRPDGPATAALWLAALVALTIALQVECARMPVDDPTTHLELTMIHEVMILDHSGPDLAAVTAGAAIKLATGVALLAGLLNPVPASAGAAAVVAGQVGAMLAVAIALGAIEATVARLRLRAISQYLLAAAVASLVAILATSWRGLP